MTPQLYERMWQLFDEVQERAPAQQSAFLDEHCLDLELRRELDQLLSQANRDAASPLNQPCPVTVKSQWSPIDDDALIGKRVGAYQIDRRLATGGMGRVYLASRQEHYAQKVAIKVIREGLATDDLLRRFGTERQVLARLNHPNIARLLDGGTLEGRPYFVMEYIDGVPIDRYCAEHSLDISDRLRLFLTVCAAVHGAHQSLILHRDLKPSNILVDREGIPKLVDFGIAKPLDIANSPDARTLTGNHFATPGYASPEQLRGDALPNIACDIYSLGVILYELLTEHRPFEGKDDSLYEIVRRVCEDEPIPLRRWRADVPRDLEVIVLKCLRKEPSQRFASVVALIEEIERFRHGEPIVSRPVGLAERTAKWLRRRPAIAALSFLTVLATACGVFGIAWENQRLVISQHKAETGEEIVAGLLHQLINVLGDDGRNAPPDVTSRQLDLIEEQAVSSLKEHRDDVLFNPLLAQSFGRLFEKLGEQYYLLARDDNAKAMFDRALELQRRLVAEQPHRLDLQHDLATTLHALSLPLRRERDYEAAGERNQEALSRLRAILQRDPNKPVYREDVARHLHHMADLHKDQWGRSPPPDKVNEVLAMYAESRALLEELVERFPEQSRYRLLVAQSDHSVGHGLYRSGNLDLAAIRYESASKEFDRLISTDSDIPDYQHEKARLEGNRASLHEKRGDHPSALTCCRHAIELAAPLVERYPNIVKYRFEYARHLTQLGDLLTAANRADAESAYRIALEQRRRLSHDAPWRGSFHGDLGLLLKRVTERVPPRDLAELRALQTEALVELTKRQELGGTEPMYESARKALNQRLKGD